MSDLRDRRRSHFVVLLNGGGLVHSSEIRDHSLIGTCSTIGVLLSTIVPGVASAGECIPTDRAVHTNIRPVLMSFQDFPPIATQCFRSPIWYGNPRVRAMTGTPTV